MADKSSKPVIVDNSALDNRIPNNSITKSDAIDSAIEGMIGTSAKIPRIASALFKELTNRTDVLKISDSSTSPTTHK